MNKTLIVFGRIFTLLALSILVNSCSVLMPSWTTADYTLYQPYPHPWVDMSQGTWAVYEVEAPFEVAAKIDEEVHEGFGNLLGGRLIDAQLDDLLLIDKSLDSNDFDKETLEQLAEASEVDYIILVKVRRGVEVRYNEQLAPFERTNEDDDYIRSVHKKVHYANIKIYDLNQAKIIFDRSCKAVLKMEDRELIDFSPSDKKMMIKAYKRLFDSLKAETKI
ncbi:MAG: hypothetical protein ACR2MS_10715 [Weeksellaceae bacterium]